MNAQTDKDESYKFGLHNLLNINGEKIFFWRTVFLALPQN